MTRDDVMALEGRELDMVVAERVFGLKRETTRIQWPRIEVTVFESPGTGGMVYYYHPDDPDVCLGRHKDGFWAMLHPLPQFSSDIAWAWLVVERMRKLGFCYYLDDHEGTHKAVFARINRSRQVVGPHYRAESESAPLSICHAAVLAATGAEVRQA